MGSTKKILVVDDAISSQELMKISLQKYKVEIIRAFNGRQAIEKAFKEKPNIIIMDLKMPEVDGFEAIRAIKANPESADVPIIVMTALYGEEAERKAREAGCASYLKKPFRIGELRQEIERFLS